MVGIISIIGYIIQASYVIINYFEYRIEGHHNIYSTMTLSMPRLHVCINLVDALNRKKTIGESQYEDKKIQDSTMMNTRMN